jgi:hypothetical protein
VSMASTATKSAVEDVWEENFNEDLVTPHPHPPCIISLTTSLFYFPFTMHIKGFEDSGEGLPMDATESLAGWAS